MLKIDINVLVINIMISFRYYYYKLDENEYESIWSFEK